MKEITKDNFEELVTKSEKPVVVDMWAPWCGPCRMVAPIFEELSKENTNIEFLKCNVDENPEVANKFSVRGIPSFLYFKEGKLVGTDVGAMNKITFQTKITTKLNS